MTGSTTTSQPLDGMGVDFSSVLKGLVTRGVLTTKISVLVVAGGERDKAVLQDAGFTDVVIMLKTSTIRMDRSM